MRLLSNKIQIALLLFVVNLGIGQSISLDSALVHLSLIDSVNTSRDYFELNIKHYGDQILLQSESMSQFRLNESSMYMSQGDQEQLLLGKYVCVFFEGSKEFIIRDQEGKGMLGDESLSFINRMSQILNEKTYRPKAEVEKVKDNLMRINLYFSKPNFSVSKFSFVFDSTHALRQTSVTYSSSYASSYGLSSMESRVNYQYLFNRKAILDRMDYLKSELEIIGDSLMILSSRYSGYEILNGSNLDIRIDD